MRKQMRCERPNCQWPAKWCEGQKPSDPNLCPECREIWLGLRKITPHQDTAA